MQSVCNVHIQWLEIWNRTQATVFWKFAIALHWIDTGVYPYIVPQPVHWPRSGLIHAQM
jgi:hypothetical protein